MGAGSQHCTEQDRLRSAEYICAPGVVTIPIPWIIALYFVMFWALTGRTIGEWIMGLRVIGADGQPPTLRHSMIRLVGYGFSAIAFWVGYAWVVIDDERQAWHDHMAKTWVVYDYERRKGGEVYEAFLERTGR